MWLRGRYRLPRGSKLVVPQAHAIATPSADPILRAVGKREIETGERHRQDGWVPTQNRSDSGHGSSFEVRQLE